MKKVDYEGGRGFTLIELLIVMAVLGVLAAVVLLAINPIQAMARSRDSGRKSTLSQIGHAVESYAVSHNGNYLPNNDATWLTTMTTAGEFNVAPVNPGYVAITYGGCGNNNQNGYCYRSDAAVGAVRAIAYTKLESASDNSKCPAGQVAWYVWASTNGRSGTVCTADTATEPTVPGVGGTVTFVD